MIKTLAAQIKEFKKDSVLTPIFMILEVLFETMIPFLMASIIDKGVETGDIGHICKVGAAMAVLNNPASVSMLSGLRKPQIRF